LELATSAAGFDSHAGRGCSRIIGGCARPARRRARALDIRETLSQPRASDVEVAETPRVEPAELERPIELRTIFLGGLFVLAALAAFYAAAEIILPIVLAFVLNLVFRPVLRLLQRAGLPRWLAALIIVLALVALVVGLGLLLSGPLTEWIGKLPETIPQLQQRLGFLSGPISTLQRGFEHVQNLATSAGSGTPQVAVQRIPLAERLLTGLRMVAGGTFTTLLVLFFVLVSGETFLRRLVELMPRFEGKRQVVDISQQIEADISVYLVTITMMNTLVGIATGTMAWLCGLGDPIMWGTFAFLLNYVPVVGPTAGVMIFLVVGLVSLDPLWFAFVPAALYLVIHVAEGETVTPILLASRFTVNPVLIILGVIFWYWMWGVCGTILATPLLAITKIICDRIEPLRPVGHFIGG
jgi:predicted PurR-regulated permease PerM